MLFALIPNIVKPKAVETALIVRDFLLSKGHKVTAENEKCAALKVAPLSDFKPEEIDFLVILGGDGTILRALHHNPELKAPVIGINVGSLGFMTDITVDSMEKALTLVLSRNYTIEERLVIEGKKEGSEESPFAINEIVFHREKNPCLIDLKIMVGGSYLNTFSADGLIISTPNGSTAYSLSAGGPILTPNLDALLITPICPHTISNRPIVISSSETIEVVYLNPLDPIEIIYDGFPLQTLSCNESIKIFAAKRKFALVNLHTHDFFSTLRTKLGWTGGLKT